MRSFLNSARWSLVILASISFFVSCNRITLSQVGRLSKGMTVVDAQQVTTTSPKYIFVLDFSEDDEIIEVHSYILNTGNYTSDYFLAYRNNRLIYWGYPHEFARSKDPLLNKIGQKAVSRLINLESN